MHFSRGPSFDFRMLSKASYLITPLLDIFKTNVSFLHSFIHSIAIHEKFWDSMKNSIDYSIRITMAHDSSLFNRFDPINRHHNHQSLQSHRILKCIEFDSKLPKQNDWKEKVDRFHTKLSLRRFWKKKICEKKRPRGPNIVPLGQSFGRYSKKKSNYFSLS